MSHHPHRPKVLPNTSSKPNFFCFEVVTPCPITPWSCLKSLYCSLLEGVPCPPQTLLFSRLNNPWSQTASVTEELQPLDHLCVPPLRSLQNVQILLIFWSPELLMDHHVGLTRAEEWAESSLSSCCPLFSGCSPGLNWFLGWMHTVLVYAQFFTPKSF